MVIGGTGNLRCQLVDIVAQLGQCDVAGGVDRKRRYLNHPGSTLAKACCIDGEGAEFMLVVNRRRTNRGREVNCCGGINSQAALGTGGDTADIDGIAVDAAVEQNSVGSG